MEGHRTPEQRQKISEGKKRWWANCTPEERFSRTRGIRAAARSEEHKEKLRRNRIVYGRLGKEDIKTIRASRSPSAHEIYWAAGFIEGDGSFKENKSSGVVRVVQVNMEPVKNLLEMFGGKISKLKLHRKNPNWNDAFEWRVTGPRARGVMMTIYSMLSAKRKGQVRLALCINEV